VRVGGAASSVTWLPGDADSVLVSTDQGAVYRVHGPTAAIVASWRYRRPAVFATAILPPLATGLGVLVSGHGDGRLNLWQPGAALPGGTWDPVVSEVGYTEVRPSAAEPATTELLVSGAGGWSLWQVLADASTLVLRANGALTVPAGAAVIDGYTGSHYNRLPGATVGAAGVPTVALAAPVSLLEYKPIAKAAATFWPSAAGDLHASTFVVITDSYGTLQVVDTARAPLPIAAATRQAAPDMGECDTSGAVGAAHLAAVA